MAAALAPGPGHGTGRFTPLTGEATARPGQPAEVAGAKAYSAGGGREWLRGRGAKPVVPRQEKEKGRRGPFDRKADRRRGAVERCINSLGWFRRVATRYEKLATHYRAMVN